MHARRHLSFRFRLELLAPSPFEDLQVRWFLLALLGTGNLGRRVATAFNSVRKIISVFALRLYDARGLTHVRSHMCALIRALSYICSSMCASIWLLSSSEHCLGSLAGVIV